MHRLNKSEIRLILNWKKAKFPGNYIHNSTGVKGVFVFRCNVTTYFLGSLCHSFSWMDNLSTFGYKFHMAERFWIVTFWGWNASVVVISGQNVSGTSRRSHPALLQPDIFDHSHLKKYIGPVISHHSPLRGTGTRD